MNGISPETKREARRMFRKISADDVYKITRRKYYVKIHSIRQSKKQVYTTLYLKPNTYISDLI